MRTTLTLDPDVAAKLKQQMRRNGKSFKETINEALRLGLEHERLLRRTTKPFVVRARPLGLKPGYSYDCIGRLLEQLDEEQTE